MGVVAPREEEEEEEYKYLRKDIVHFVG